MLCRRTGSSVVAYAPAKLNLFLRVIGKRTDGYHEIETVMTAVDLYDTLVFTPSAEAEISLAVRMANGISASHQVIPTGPENLVVRAAMLLKRRCEVQRGVHIELVKRIPAAAGLGGGSSDAAATLGALNAFWSCGLTGEDLLELASQLGSDIPFFLGSKSTAICRGRGEILEPLSVQSGLTFILAKPQSGLSTADVYRRCRPEPADEKLSRLIEAMIQGKCESVVRNLRNDLQFPAASLNRDVIQLARLFSEQGLTGHQLSGSGTAYFGICRSRTQGLSIAARLRQQGVPWVRVVQNRC